MNLIRLFFYYCFNCVKLSCEVCDYTDWKLATLKNIANFFVGPITNRNYKASGI